MADKRIKVVVLEGEFAALSAMGFPTSVCLQLQESGLKVAKAMWSTKSSSAGFSVSFFCHHTRSQNVRGVGAVGILKLQL